MKKHLKKIVLLLAITFAGAMASAWDWTSYCENLDGNHWLVKAGVGYGYSLLNVKSDGYSVKGGASGFVIPVQGEFLLSKIPLGITMNFRPMFGKYSGLKTSGFAIMAGANYHVAPGPKWLDLYAGAEMGVFYNSYKYEIPSIGDERSILSVGGPSERAVGGIGTETKKLTGAGFAFGAHVGASFLFTKHFGVNAEVGYPTLISTSALYKF